MSFVPVQRILSSQTTQSQDQASDSSVFDAAEGIHAVFGHSVSRFPLLNIAESETHYSVVVEVPGVLAEDIAIEVSEESLVLACRRRRPVGLEEENYRRQERRFGQWQREIVFPRRVDTELAVASIEFGILTIEVVKSPVSMPRRVPVLDKTDKSERSQPEGG